MAIKNRTELKSYFIKNAIPTEGNFADLIDSQLNQADGVFKPDGEPLSVVAAPGDQRRVLRLYAGHAQANPDWMISLNPAQDPADPAPVTRPGLGITDGAGNTRLFVDAGTGRVGVGTNTPALGLDVVGGARIASGPIVPSVGNSENHGIQFPKDPGGGGGDRAFIRYYVESGEATKLLIGNNNDANDRISLFQMNAERLTVYNGRVGINNVTPGATLDVTGDARVTGKLTIGDWTLEASGEHLFVKRAGRTVARFSTTHDRLQVFQNIDGKAPYFFFNSGGASGRHKG